MTRPPVLQSGQVTPGHLAAWSTDGVIEDAGPLRTGQFTLATLFQADFDALGDQPLIVDPAITAFQITGIVVTNSTVSLSSAVGGFYPQPFQGGTSIVGPSQSYAAITTPNDLLNCTLTSYGQNTRFSANNLGQLLGADNQSGLAIYFNLSVAQGAPAVADIYLIGIDLTPPT